jgi:hypothetical protein
MHMDMCHSSLTQRSVCRWGTINHTCGWGRCCRDDHPFSFLYWLGWCSPQYKGFDLHPHHYVKIMGATLHPRVWGCITLAWAECWQRGWAVSLLSKWLSPWLSCVFAHLKTSLGETLEWIAPNHTKSGILKDLNGPLNLATVIQVLHTILGYGVEGRTLVVTHQAVEDEKVET